MKPIKKDGWTLVHEKTGVPVNDMEVVKNFRDEDRIVHAAGSQPPHKPSSTGRIGTDAGSIYPNCCDLKWVKDGEA